MPRHNKKAPQSAPESIVWILVKVLMLPVRIMVWFFVVVLMAIFSLE